ncbi:hypothetical protein, partial [Gemmobacter caeni]|uniref:hypothetical protein n=1 Tax=Gemmobacter caeni TaxID=589035 RepID=UPI001B862287
PSSLPLRFVPATVRFGEAASRPTPKNPQEQKTPKTQLSSSNRHRTLIFLKKAERTCDPKIRRDRVIHSRTRQQTDQTTESPQKSQTMHRQPR